MIQTFERYSVVGNGLSLVSNDWSGLSPSYYFTAVENLIDFSKKRLLKARHLKQL